MEYVRPIRIRKDFDISFKQLKTWSSEYDIRTVTTPGGRTLYHYDDFIRLIGKETKKKNKSIIYTRVSSHQQKDDLERQVCFMQGRYPGVEIIKDIGSGINFKRKGLQRLLDLVSKGDIEYIYVSDKDRLCRFGYELIEWISKHFGTKIIFYYHEESSERELADDLLAVTNFFVSKKNGQKSARNKRERRKKDLEKKGYKSD